MARFGIRLLLYNGDLLVSNHASAINGDPNQPSEIVEFTVSGP